MHVADVMSTYKVDKYLDSFGISIKPEYKNLGIEHEFLKARLVKTTTRIFIEYQIGRYK